LSSIYTTLSAEVFPLVSTSDHLSDGPERCTAVLPISPVDKREEQVSTLPTEPPARETGEDLQRWQELIQDLARDLNDNVDVSARLGRKRKSSLLMLTSLTDCCGNAAEPIQRGNETILQEQSRDAPLRQLTSKTDWSGQTG
jgi:hypothetical protein